MWYEIIPTFTIITACITIPSVFNYISHKLIYKGNAFRRDITSEDIDLKLYQRDLFFGNPYVRKGLENIPDSQ